MTGSVPPRLLGPRMAVWASFPFDDRLLSEPGAPVPVHASWAWAMAQWDTVARAGRVVRLVVVDQVYAGLELGSDAGPGRRLEVTGKFEACRDVDQLLFGRVYVAGGKLPLGRLGERFDDPLRPGRQVRGVADQIEAWRRSYGDQIDGLYLDSGPTECTDPAVPGSDPSVPGNFRSYIPAIGVLGYKVFLQAARYPDAQPGDAWLRSLGADFVEVWEGGLSPYTLRFGATDPCRPERPAFVPDWWEPDPSQRWSRVHVINDCLNTDTMSRLVRLATGGRGAGTVWITVPRDDPTLGAVYDVLPPYWDEEVALFAEFLRRDEQAAQDAKDSKDVPDAAAKEAKDTKDDADDAAAEIKETKDTKDDKDVSDTPPKDKEDPDTDKDTAKEDADSKSFKDDEDKPPVFLKDSEVRVKTMEFVGRDARSSPWAAPLRGGSDERPEASGRTFIRPHERPPVGDAVVADPPAYPAEER